MTRVHRLLPLALLTAVAVTGLALTVGPVWGGGGGEPARPWTDGSVHGPWRSVFDGHGTNTGLDNGLSLSPAPARTPAETHAGLIVSTRQYQDLTLRATLRTVAQLRTPTPNPWEVAWLVWAYTDPDHFYYVILKPNGWELGKRDPAYPGGQRFLATGDQPFPVDHPADVRVTQHGPHLEATVDGHPLVAFDDHERPYPTGSIGAYTEDAHVEFTDVSAEPAG
ncbi:calcium-binding protein [Streptomyces rubellomurinus]|uniref:Calcium-binding protein n=2 Tax=Streptomyces TaxID=1883 RepID=A0A0F2TCY1_STRR3|nr:calcium-binding protein [Streptomyces rubellomurinus]KJS59587.1 calcium-binding protein [Streptomyces rubellomurinus]